MITIRRCRGVHGLCAQLNSQFQVVVLPAWQVWALRAGGYDGLVGVDPSLALFEVGRYTLRRPYDVWRGLQGSTS